MELKRQMLAIQDVYVPVKRRQTLDLQKVDALAESILIKGQEAPILVRPDGNRFVLVEGLHRLEACKALGETTVRAYLVQARKHLSAPGALLGRIETIGHVQVMSSRTARGDWSNYGRTAIGSSYLDATQSTTAAVVAASGPARG